VLSLPVQVSCEDTVALGDFGKWIIAHIDIWFSWAQQLGVGINRVEDIVLVTGAHRTKSWTNVVFLERRMPGYRSSFNKLPIPALTGSFHPTALLGPCYTVALLVRYDEIANESWMAFDPPQDLPEDQCIFIRGFRVTRKLKILPRALKAAAGPNPDPKGSDEEPDMELIAIATITEVKYFTGDF